MIATGYGLPFQFRCSESSATASGPLGIRVRTALPDADGLVVSTLRLFEQLALTGALSGGRLAPWDSTFALTERPGQDASEFLFRVDHCRLTDEAWVVLCHMLLRLHKNLPVQSVDIVAAGDISPRVLVSEAADTTYPIVHPSLPFILDDREPEGGGYSFFIRLESALTAHNELCLNQALRIWVRAVLAGAYAMAPIDPVQGYVEPSGSGVDTYEGIIEWAVFKLRADPVAALAGLVNLFAWFHVHCQPLSTFEIG